MLLRATLWHASGATAGLARGSGGRPAAAAVGGGLQPVNVRAGSTVVLVVVDLLAGSRSESKRIEVRNIKLEEKAHNHAEFGYQPITTASREGGGGQSAPQIILYSSCGAYNSMVVAIRVVRLVLFFNARSRPPPPPTDAFLDADHDEVIIINIS